MLEPITCRTYGIFVGMNEKENSLVMASTIAEEKDLPGFSDVNIIPITTVRKIDRLEF